MCAPAVAERGDLLLRLDDRLAPGAMAALGQAGLGAGRGHRGIRHRAVTQCVHAARLRRLAAAASACLLAGLGARCRRRLDICAPAVAERGDLLLRLDARLAPRAMAAGGEARLRAGRGHRGIRHRAVTQCRDRPRRLRAAARARRRLDARCRAGGRRSRHITAVAVAQRGHRLLRRQDGVAAGAVAALRLARRRAGRRNGRIRHGHMAQRRDKHRAAHAAGLRRGAGRRRSGDMPGGRRNDRTADCADLVLRARRVRTQSMPLSGHKYCTADCADLVLCARRLCARCMTGGLGKHCIADQADLVLRARRRRARRMSGGLREHRAAGQARLRSKAGGRRAGRMTCGGRELRTADRADLRLRAGGRRAGRMAGGCDLCVCRIITAAARLVCFPADLRARRRFAGVLCKIMAERCDCPRRLRIAARARRRLDARCCAGGRRCCYITAVVMPQRGHRLLRLEHGIAAGAVAAFRKACHRAGSRHGRICHRAVPQCVHAARLRRLAAAASTRLFARRRTAGRDRHDIIAVIMPERRERPRRRGAAARASCRLRARRRACRRFGRRIAAIVMAQRRRLIAGIAVTAAAAIMVCIAARGTRRAVIRCAHVMPQSGRRSRRRIAAAAAGAALGAARSTRRR